VKHLLQAAILLSLVQAHAFSQVYVRVTKGSVTSAVNNGGSVTLNAPALRETVDFSVSVTYAGLGVLRFNGAPRLSGSSDFTAGETVPAVAALVSGQSVVIPVRFQASTARLTSAQLTWDFTETLAQVQTTRAGALVLGINGTAPSLELGYSFALDGNFNPLSMQEGQLPFPLTPLNSISTAGMILLNRGTGPGQLESITVTGNAFSLASLPIVPATIDAGALLRFQIRYQPRTDGTHQGVLTLRYANGNVNQVTLRGEALTSYLKYQIQMASDSATGIIPDSVISLPSTAIGQRNVATIRFTNASPFDITVPSVAITGQGFALVDVPFTPLTMAPYSSQFLGIVFAPTQGGIATGRLRIGNDSFELAGAAQGSQLQYRYSSKAGDVALVPGATVTFPNGAIGEVSSVTVTVTNSGNVAAPIMTIAVPSVTPTGFGLSGLPSLPFSIGPKESIQFTVQFQSLTAGPTTGTLRINSDQFGLFGTADALPGLTDVVILGPSTVQAFEQPRISLSLAKSYPVALRGTLTLSVESDGFAIDPSTQFSTGGRNVNFTIPAGSLRATFANGMQEIRFQSGSVAGAFVLTPTFFTATGTSIASDAVRPLRIALASGTPRMLSGGVSTRTLSSLTVEIIGVTTTRSLTRINVKIKPRAGYQVANTDYTQDLTGPSLLWFNSSASSGYGGQFVATLPLQFNSNVSVAAGTDLVQAIESITVTFLNERGSSEPVNIPVL